MENFPDHAERKTFPGTSGLFGCIILIGTRSNGPGFLLWVSKPHGFVSDLSCGCIHQIPHVFILRRHLSLCCLSPVLLHWNCCCTELQLCLSGSPAWKILSCYWDVWITLVMPCTSLSVLHRSVFQSFLPLYNSGGSVLLAVPVNRVLLAFVRVLNDRNKDFLLPAGGLFLAPYSNDFFLNYFLVK